MKTSRQLALGGILAPAFYYLARISLRTYSHLGSIRIPKARGPYVLGGPMGSPLRETNSGEPRAGGTEPAQA
jgi:hypothetical protein